MAAFGSFENNVSLDKTNACWHFPGKPVFMKMDIADGSLPSSVEESGNQSLPEAAEKILAVFWKRGRLGASFFNCETFEVSFLKNE